MPSAWPTLSYGEWGETCDTLHAHTQLLGKLAVALAPPEPQLQHAALRLTARGWETAPLPAPDSSGTFGVTLDLRTHQAVIEASHGGKAQVPLAPDRSVGQVTREVLAAVGSLVGPVTITVTPQEVPWAEPLDADGRHARYDPDAVTSYFAAATQAALVLSKFRAAYRGRSTPVNAWWGSFDLAVSLFSGRPADPPSERLHHAQRHGRPGSSHRLVAGRSKTPDAAFYAYAHPAPDGFSDATLAPAAAHWDADLGEYILRWSDVCASADPQGTALEFAHSAFVHACAVCNWDPALSASAEGNRRRSGRWRGGTERPLTLADSVTPVGRPATFWPWTAATSSRCCRSPAPGAGTPRRSTRNRPVRSRR